MNNPMILMCAPNGARLRKQDHIALPLTPEELADCAQEIVAEGASLMHLHVRDENGAHTLDASTYRKALDVIRNRVGEQLILQITTEAVGIYAPQEQIAIIKDLRPEAVSIALRELCPDSTAEAEFAELCEWMKAEKVFPQIILYSASDVQRFEALRQRGMFASQQPFILYVLGSYQNNIQLSAAEIEETAYRLANLETHWSFCGFGANESIAAHIAAKHGGHMRVGFENNRLIPGQGEARNNAELAAVAADAARAAKRELASAAEVRHMFAEWLV